MKQTVAHQVKLLELLSKRLMKKNLLGETRSVQKGAGLEFNQLRDYQMGDDVRAIDWNSSARMNKLLVKEFTDEQYKNIIIALDCSASLWYGSSSTLKSEIAAQLASLISYAALLHKDAVGLMLFSDSVHRYIPPSRGKKHIYFLLDLIFSAQRHEGQTNLNALFDYLLAAGKKNSMVILISDCIDDRDYEHSLKMIDRCYDFMVMRTLDPLEKELPNLGLLPLKDPETGQEVLIDTRSKKMHKELKERCRAQNTLFAQHRIDLLDVSFGHPPVEQLLTFFKQRALGRRL